MSGSWLTGRVAAAVALCITGVVGTMVGPLAGTPINDLILYRSYAELLSAGEYPYLDFGLEYPPLALPVFWLPHLVGGGQAGYEIAFAILVLIAALVVQQVVWSIDRERGPLAAWLVVAAPLLIGALLRTRFDAVALSLTMVALLLLVRDRPRSGFAVLGIAGMLKLFPLALVPVAAAWLAGRGRTREAPIGVGIAAAVVVVISLPVLGAGYIDSYRFHLERPVQIESTPATLLWIGGDPVITGTASNPDRFRSQGVDAPGDGLVATAFAILQALGLAVACLLAATAGGDRTRRLVLTTFLALLSIIALGKVLSPQFLIWLVPFAALAWTYGERAVAALAAAAIVLTSIEFPSRYFDLIAGDDGVFALVGVRNLLLVLALTTLAARLAAPVLSRRRALAASR
jgi:hypothetical protein